MRATILLLTLALAVSACSRAERAIEATNSMPQKMDETLAEMKRTNEVVRQQPVQISFENLLSEELGPLRRSSESTLSPKMWLNSFTCG